MEYDMLSRLELLLEKSNVLRGKNMAKLKIGWFAGKVFFPILIYDNEMFLQ